MRKFNQRFETAEFLKQNKNTKFTAREIAEKLRSKYVDHYDYRKDHQYNHDEKKLINQVTNEIVSSRKELVKYGITWDDFERPKKLFYNHTEAIPANEATEDNNEKGIDEFDQSTSEYELYQPLMDYLRSVFDLRCMRINEATSVHRGRGANEWLHPDIVAVEAFDKILCQEVQSVKNICLGSSKGIHFWSFEVKKIVDMSNFRKYYFQAVSNSSWAHQGYLVACEFVGDVEEELRILSSLHGIGVIKLDKDNPVESEIKLPATMRVDADWRSVDRIAQVNSDFKKFLANVVSYLSNYNETVWANK